MDSHSSSHSLPRHSQDCPSAFILEGARAQANVASDGRRACNYLHIVSKGGRVLFAFECRTSLLHRERSLPKRTSSIERLAHSAAVARCISDNRRLLSQHFVQPTLFAISHWVSQWPKTIWPVCKLGRILFLHDAATLPAFPIGQSPPLMRKQLC